MKIAAFTIVKDEKDFLPIWISHYSKYFALSDIYVLDNDSQDGSTDNLSCNTIRVTHETAFDTSWLLTTAQDFQKTLLANYDYVLFAEADEMVFPDPRKYKNFADFVNATRRDAYRCSGYEIMQIPGKDHSLNIGESLLRQRSMWYKTEHFCKPLLSKIPLRWIPGFHNAKAKIEICDSLYLLHLHKIDFGIALRRNLNRIKMPWNETTLKKNQGWQNRLTGGDLKIYLSTTIQPLSELIPIPEYIKAVL